MNHKSVTDLTVPEGDMRDKGGRILKKGKWNNFYYMIEVCVEYPGSQSIEEANEDAAEFVETLSHTRGRVQESFATITKVKELPNGVELGELLHKSGNMKSTKQIKTKKKKKKVKV